jgi:hypothetical protein
MTIEKMAFAGLALWVAVVLIYGLYRAATERPTT